MYNKLFTKILDSSIWLESTATRIVWLTFIASMDEDGFAQFAAYGNLANRARVTLEEARVAVLSLESPDPESGDPANDGRRIERVPGGWMILNAEKYRKLVTRSVIQEGTRERVRRYRARGGNAPVTLGNACNDLVTLCNDPVTPSDTDTEVQVQKEPCSGNAGALHVTAAALPAPRSPNAFIASFKVAWELKYSGEKWVCVGPKDAGIAKRLQAVLTDEELAQRLTRYLQSGKKFHIEARHSLGVFAASVNEFGADSLSNEPKYMTTADLDARDARLMAGE